MPDSLAAKANRLAADGLWAGAEAALRQVVRLRTDELGPQAPATLAARGELAAALAALGRHEEAEDELRAVRASAAGLRWVDGCSTSTVAAD
ncbi:tetratricopeptide repeat protein [Kitasatospora sp. NPDC001683]